MNCRGEKTRIEIVMNYDVTPIAHLRVLDGMTLKSDAGPDITNNYFLFKCVHKITEQEEIICCGKPTAAHFCSLLCIDLPRIFNPLKEPAKEKEGNNSNGTTEHWNSMRKQLYNATMLFILWLKNKYHKVLLSIKEELEQNIDKEPPIRIIKSVNTLYCQYKTTARDVVENLARKNHLKDFEFNLLVDVLEKKGITQYFEHTPHRGFDKLEDGSEIND